MVSLKKFSTWSSSPGSPTHLCLNSKCFWSNLLHYLPHIHSTCPLLPPEVLYSSIVWCLSTAVLPWKSAHLPGTAPHFWIPWPLPGHGNFKGLSAPCSSFNLLLHRWGQTAPPISSSSRSSLLTTRSMSCPQGTNSANSISHKRNRFPFQQTTQGLSLVRKGSSSHQIPS